MDKNQRLLNGTFDRSKKLSTRTWSLNRHEVIFKNTDICSDDQLTCEDCNKTSSKQDDTRVCACLTNNNGKKSTNSEQIQSFVMLTMCELSKLTCLLENF